MLDFPRWKVRLVLLVVLIGALFSIPSFFPETVTEKWPAIARQRVNLGLDLAGGSYLLLEADTADVAKQRLATMEELVRTEMRRGDPRIDIGEISIQNNKISFMVRNVGQVDAARERLLPLTNGAGMTGQRDWNIEVFDSNWVDLTPTAAGLDNAVKSAMDVATEVVRKRIDELGTREPTIVKQGATRIVVQVPGLQNPSALKALLGKTAKLEFKLVDLAADPAQVQQGRAPAGSQVLPMVDGGFIAVKRQVMVNGDELVDASQGFGENGTPDVIIKFNGQGGRKFARVTQENVQKPFAIILDNQVISAPNINEPILGGTASISGNFTVESANQLAIALRSGKLPVALKVIEERTVGPQLGADSIRAGVIASVIAAVAVIVFMILTYGRFGIYATIAVILNIFIILGVMSVLNATLTLPGIAGFVLTLGTAVDANVLINERIREERRRGRNVLQAIELGYKEASRTIFEANVTHAIAGFIMLVLGSGPIKGFAIVLLIGIATSVFTAVSFTRMLSSFWLRRHRPTEITI